MLLDRGGRSAAEVGVEGCLQGLAEEVAGEDGEGEGQAGVEEDVGRGKDGAAALAEHGAPLGRRRLGAEAEEAEAGGLEDGGADAEHGLGEEGRGAGGQDVAPQQARRAGTDGAGGEDVVLLLGGEDAGEEGQCR